MSESTVIDLNQKSLWEMAAMTLKRQLIRIRRRTGQKGTGEKEVHHECDFVRFRPNFEEEHPGGNQRPSTSLPLPPTSRENLWLDGYLEYPHAAKALYIYKHVHAFPGIGTQAQRHSSQRL
ncbi:hypothetical protein TNCV_2325981 [Trichonephila clavipes]|nr:hypothetical protein TNCV_2325981 [Trichonephila clavipes]